MGLLAWWLEKSQYMGWEGPGGASCKRKEGSMARTLSGSPGEESEQPCLHAGGGVLVLKGSKCSVFQAPWFLKQVAILLSCSPVVPVLLRKSVDSGPTRGR